jgi:hypothetical protein
MENAYKLPGVKGVFRGATVTVEEGLTKSKPVLKSSSLRNKREK